MPVTSKNAPAPIVNEQVWSMSSERKVSLRTAAFMLGIDRVARAHKSHLRCKLQVVFLSRRGGFSPEGPSSIL